MIPTPEQLPLILAAVLAAGVLNLIVCCLILRAVIVSAVVAAHRKLAAEGVRR